nr:activity-regulated cytoskeleton-associated protein-like [Leptinotarsa decemlineata]
MYPLPAGNENEDPEIFISRLLAELVKSDIPEGDWVQILFAQLTGDASKWAAIYSQTQISWSMMVARLKQKYASPELIAKLTAKFYGESQNRNTKVDVFIIKKFELAKRLFPGVPERGVLQVIAQLLSPELRCFFRGKPLVNIETLIQGASNIEEDLRLSKQTY